MGKNKAWSNFPADHRAMVKQTTEQNKTKQKWDSDQSVVHSNINISKWLSISEVSMFASVL